MCVFDGLVLRIWNILELGRPHRACLYSWSDYPYIFPMVIVFCVVCIGPLHGFVVWTLLVFISAFFFTLVSDNHFSKTDSFYHSFQCHTPSNAWQSLVGLQQFLEHLTRIMPSEIDYHSFFINFAHYNEPFNLI